MQLNVYKGQGEAAGSLAVPDEVFAQAFNEPLVHQVVTAYLSAARAGTHAQKTRAQVRGGGAKPWKQKGSGRARAGTIRSPLWRGGGKVFAAVTADYSQKVNKKSYRAALRSILSELIRQDRLLVVEEFAVEQPKTRALLAKLKAVGAGADVLLVTGGITGELVLAARNLPKVEVCEAARVDPVSLIGYDKVVMTAAAVKKLGESLA